MFDRDADNGTVVALRVDVLWIDFQSPEPERELLEALAGKYRLVRSQPDELLLYDVGAPGLIIMETDIPDELVLKLFQALKLRFPRTPVILLSRTIALELALWAIKVRVWDLVHTPLDQVSRQELLGRLDKLLLQLRRPDEARKAIVSSASIPPLSPQTGDKHGLARLQPALEIIRLDFNRHLSEPVLAKSCAMSVHHFSRTFSKLMGLPLQEYIVRIRLEAATNLLLSSNRPVSTIALDVGFNDASYFSRAFKKHYQLSPSEYRANKGHGDQVDKVSVLKLITR